MSENLNLKYTAPALEVIHLRRSVRTYSSRPIPPELLAEICELLEHAAVPFGVKPRLALISKSTARGEKRERLGTYGFIVGAQAFIAAAVPRTNPDPVALGFALEDVILALTGLGLGTCWLGGTFSRASFGRALALGSDEFIPVVTPVGFAAKFFRAPVDFLIKPNPLAKPRLPWGQLFFDDGFDRPLTREAAGAFAPAIEAVRLAPSAVNRQPWRVVRQDNRWHFFLQHKPESAQRYGLDLQLVDLGIALRHFDAVTRETGLSGNWISSPPSLTAPDRCEYIRSWENR